jgi:hypothetical protein
MIMEKDQHTGTGIMMPGCGTYYTVVYSGILGCDRPHPSGEIAALLMLSDAHLSYFKKDKVTVGELLANDAKIFVQAEITIPRNKPVKPHGAAKYLIDHRAG